MLLTHHRFALLIALTISAASLQPAYARGDIASTPSVFDPLPAFNDAGFYTPVEQALHRRLPHSAGHHA